MGSSKRLAWSCAVVLVASSAVLVANAQDAERGEGVGSVTDQSERSGLDPRGESVRDEQRSDRPFAPSGGPEPGPGVEVETDLVTMRAEQDRAAAYDAMRDEAVREARIAEARREAPFDLSWGLGI